MISSKDIRRLAWIVFILAKREIWLGGRGVGDWPGDVERPSVVWARSIWTMSPEVELGGDQIRVCVLSEEKELAKGCEVLVFVNGRLAYPGGAYSVVPRWFHHAWLLGEPWELRIARLEQWSGGRPGHVHRRDLLIQEGERRLEGVLSTAEPVLDEAYEAARQEVDAIGQRRKAWVALARGGRS